MPDPIVGLSFMIGLLSGILSFGSLTWRWRAKRRSGKIERFHKEIEPVLRQIEKLGIKKENKKLVEFVVAFASNLIFGSPKPPPRPKTRLACL